MVPATTRALEAFAVVDVATLKETGALLLRVQARTSKAVKLTIKRFIGWSPRVQRYGRPDRRYTGHGEEGTGELEMNACAGLLLLRSRATFARCRLSRPDADLARPEELDRPRPGLGARVGRTLPRGDRKSTRLNSSH